MGPTGDKYRVVQIHPTRRCNLRCLHCYSASAPEERDRLPVPLLLDAITDAAAEGYSVASFSGGEPLLYKPLGDLLEHAHACGLATTITSNGMLLNEARAEMLRGRVDLLAISLDGSPDSHNWLRAHDRAFEIMESHLEFVRKAGIPFGFIFTLTQYNVDQLEWVADFAIKQGAKLLQIHPLEESGRAGLAMRGHQPDQTECTYAYIEAERIRKFAGEKVVVQLDLVHRGLLHAIPDRLLADLPECLDLERPLSGLVSPLVIEADGEVVPLTYGFARPYSLGNLTCARLQELAKGWRESGYQAFRKLCRLAYEEASAPHEMPYFDWYEAVGRRAERLVSISA
jgi:Fe-coproporphyrin III synthase